MMSRHSPKHSPFWKAHQAAEEVLEIYHDAAVNEAPPKVNLAILVVQRIQDAGYCVFPDDRRQENIKVMESGIQIIVHTPDRRWFKCVLIPHSWTPGQIARELDRWYQKDESEGT